MNAPRIALLVAALLFIAPANLLAQQEPVIAPGDRVRVTAPSLGVEGLVCILQSARPDGIAVDRGPRWLPLASVTKLEVSRGRRSHALPFGVIGVFVGGLGGGFLGSLSCIDQPPECGTRNTVIGALGGGLSLGLTGAAIGSAIKVDRWEDVPLGELRVGPSSVDADGIEVSITLRL